MNLCVYCSSSNALEQKYYTLAQELGTQMAKNQINLVFGGSNVGLMKEIADAVKAGNAKVTGVIPLAFKEKGLEYNNADKIICSKDLRERKQIMEKQSDAFLAMPGGFGTLDEVIEILTLKQLHLHNKPIVFLNAFNFYDGLIQQFTTFFTENIAKPSFAELYFFANDINQVINYLKSYKQIEPKDKWYEAHSK